LDGFQKRLRSSVSLPISFATMEIEGITVSPPLLSDQMGRKMSFTSAGLAMGSWPESVKMCEPTINIVLYFETCPSVSALINEVVCKFLEYERFSGVPVVVGKDGSNDWRFRNVATCDPFQLVRTFTVNGDKELHALLEDEICGGQLRVGRNDLPWWEFVRIENSQSSKGSNSSVVVFRMDHTIGDGLSLVSIIEHIAVRTIDGSALSRLVMKQKFNKPKMGFCSKVQMAFKSILSFIKVLRLANGKYDDDTAFSWNVNKDLVYNQQRKHLFFPDIPLGFVKDLKNAYGNGATVNDIMLTIVSQTIHDYCQAQNDPMFANNQNLKKKSLQCRALMPIAFPLSEKDKQDKTMALRNKFVFLSTDLGVGVADTPIDRLHHICNTTAELKNSPIALVQQFIQTKIAPLLPTRLCRQTVYDTFTRHSLVLTNVPGPPESISIAGEPIQCCRMFINNLIPNLGILSYNGTIYSSISLDPNAIRNSSCLHYLFHKAFVQLANDLNVTVPSDLTTTEREDRLL